MKQRNYAAVLLGVLVLAGTGAVHADAADAGNLQYTVEDDHVVITGLKSYVEELVIPAEIDGYPVTEIAEKAFYSVSARKIVLPEGLTTIGQYAFSGGKVDASGAMDHQTAQGMAGDKLTEIQLPSTLTYMGSRAFFDCDGLTSVVVPESLEQLYANAFASCDALETAELHCPVVGNLAFSGCKALTSVTLAETVEVIGYEAFASTGVEEIDLPDSITTIGDNAFTGTPLLNAQSGAVKYVDDWLVACDSKAVDITIAEGTRGIANKSFFDCASMKTLTIPEGVEIIGSNVFGSGLTEISLPESLRSVGAAAFSLCEKMKSVTFPSHVEYVAENQFILCNKLESVTFANPYTEIGMLAGTIPPTTVIYGYTGSTAQAYAEQFERTFESLGMPPEYREMLGDVNRDGRIDASDAAALLVRIAENGAGGADLTDVLSVGDVNGNGGIEPEDAAMILVYIAETGSGSTTLTLEEFMEQLLQETQPT